jgi:serine/threonine-protein kinase HipA
MGVLSAQQAKGRKAFSFSYEKSWMNTEGQRIIDPDIQWYSGPQHPVDKENFGIIIDSMPDTWGRKLMIRKEAQSALDEGRNVKTLYDIDFLIDVYDETRMGALRFKLDPDGPFLDNNDGEPTPPWTSAKQLQHAALQLESENPSKSFKKYLAILLAPGSSLGGARPKANIVDDQGDLWIAKFPAKSDLVDKAAWEFLAYELALSAGIQMSPSKIEKISGDHHTFFTKRFDRKSGGRIHFSSAMTMTGNTEEKLRDRSASYLDLALFIQTYGANIRYDLRQLWRRLVFNISVSNTDDHLRNHGFILTDKGWMLSPAFDLNPSTDKSGLQLNIDMHNNALDLELARSVGDFFQLTSNDMDVIIDEVSTAVSSWKNTAKQIGISRREIELMTPAFQL